MKLKPFDPSYTEYVLKFFNEKEYQHFARRVNRMLNIYECSRLPEILCREVLIPVNEMGSPIGIVTINYDEPGVAYTGGAIELEHQNKKYSYEIGKATEDYLFNVRGIEIVRTDILECDEHLGAALEKVGYTRVGNIPNFLKVNGKYEGIVFYYKSLR